MDFYYATPRGYLEMARAGKTIEAGAHTIGTLNKNAIGMNTKRGNLAELPNILALKDSSSSSIDESEQ